MGSLLRVIGSVILALALVFVLFATVSVGLYFFAGASPAWASHAAPPLFGVNVDHFGGVPIERAVTVRWAPIIFVVPFLFLAFFAILMVLLVKLLKGSERTPKRAVETAVSEESRMIRDMYEGFEKMGERLEALETILVSRAGGNR